MRHTTVCIISERVGKSWNSDARPHGGSLLSSTKGSFRFNPEARSSEVGGDDILLASWRDFWDKEKAMVGRDSFFLRESQKTETKIWLFPKKREHFTVIKLGDNQWDPFY